MPKDRLPRFARNDKSGFTLIELLVVISIIAILSAVGLVSYQGIRSKALQAKYNGDINSIKKAYETNYDPTLNGGQGGYKGLLPSNFANGQIPTLNGQPLAADSSNSYIVTGPVGAGNTGGNFTACVNMSNGSKCISSSQPNCTCVASTQGTPFTSGTGSSNPSCDLLTSGLIGHWKFDEGTDNTCSGGTNDTCNSGSQGSTLDGAGSGFSSPATSTSGWTNSGKFGKALIFDGTNDYVNTAYTKTSGDGTVAVWFRAQTQTSDTGSIFRPIVIQGNFDGVGNTNPEGILISMTRSGNSNVGKINTNWGNDSVSFTTTEKYDDNQWHYAVITKSGTTGTLYIDGISKGTWVTTDAVNTGTNFQIGGSTTASARKFLGTVDDVRVYNHALPPSEISALYNDGNGCLP